MPESPGTHAERLRGCRQPGCTEPAAGMTVWCSEHRYPARRDDGICLNTSCNRDAETNTPWCYEHTATEARRAEIDYLRAALEAVTRERDDAREWFDKHFVDEDGEPECATVTEMLAHVFQWGDGAWGCAGQQTVKAEAAEQMLEATKDALREIAEHRQDRSYNHATAHAYADVRDIARAALAEDK